MSESPLLHQVEEFARSYCQQGAEGPDLWGHVQLVRHFALGLARAEGVDPLVPEIAALLHDIGRCRGDEGHHTRSHEWSKVLLESISLSAEARELILECVLKHGTRYASEDNLIEVRVIQSADALATLFDDGRQEYARENMPRETVLQLFARTMTKITLESARKMAEPQMARLKALLP